MYPRKRPSLPSGTCSWSWIPLIHSQEGNRTHPLPSPGFMNPKQKKRPTPVNTHTPQTRELGDPTSKMVSAAGRVSHVGQYGNHTVVRFKSVTPCSGWQLIPWPPCHGSRKII